MSDWRLWRWDPDRDGPLSEGAMRARMQRMGFDVRCCRYPPGMVFPPHVHEVVDKLDGVVSGRFRLRMFGRSPDLGPGESRSCRLGASMRSR